MDSYDEIGKLIGVRDLPDALVPGNPVVEVRLKLANGAVATLEAPAASPDALTVTGRNWLSLPLHGWKLRESPEPEPTAETSLPRWKCHKVVEAFRIESIFFIPADPSNPGGAKKPRKLRGRDRNWTAIVSDEYWNRHRPEVGGYYVRYEDGYESFSPREAFEQGYTPLFTLLCPRQDGERSFPMLNPEFDVHKLNDDGLAEVAIVATHFDQLLSELTHHIPEGRYLSIVKTKLEEACFFAKKGIAVNPGYQLEVK